MNDLFRIAEQAGLPDPDEVWLVTASGQVTGKITNVGIFLNLEPEDGLNDGQ